MAGRELQAGGEVRPCVIAPVAVRVGQKRDDALRRCRRPTFERVRIATVLGDVHPATIVEGDRHGTLNERFRGDEVNAVAGLQGEARKRLGG